MFCIAKVYEKGLGFLFNFFLFSIFYVKDVTCFFWGGEKTFVLQWDIVTTHKHSKIGYYLLIILQEFTK